MQQSELVGFRLSPQQLRLWQLGEGLGERRAFRVQCAVEIAGAAGTGGLTVDALRDAVAAAVDRHEILRSTFNRMPAMQVPVQVVAERGDFDLALRDAGDLPPAEQDEVLRDVFRELMETPFDLENGPALKLRLVTLAPDRQVLFVASTALHLDGSGLKNLVDEIVRRCAGAADDEEEPLQYADVAEWQYEQLESDGDGGEFWLAQALPDPLAPPMPGERPGAPERDGFEPRLLDFEVAAERRSRIEDLARRHEVSPADVLFTVWQVLLYRLTQTPELVLGVAFDGRQYEDLAAALGPFERYLPIPARLAPELTFDRALRRNRRLLTEVGGWQDQFSWERVGGRNGDSDEPAFLPLCFEYAEAWNGAPASPLPVRMRRRYVCTDRFRLRLSCTAIEDRLDLELHYDANRFDAREIRRLAERFDRLLTGVLDDPESTLERFELVGETERAWLLREQNRTAADFPADRGLHELIVEQAQRTPDAVAVRAGGRFLSYRELARRAAALGRRLAAAGVGPEVIVGVGLERSVETALALLAIWDAGGAYLPLDPAYPRQRIDFLLDETSAPLVLTRRSLRARFDPERVRVICLDDDRALDDPAGGRSAAGARPGNLAYVLYTSGSTGRPKGVMVPHRGLVNYLYWAVRTYGLTAGGAVPVHSPLGFDLTVTSLFAPLVAGGTVVLLAEGEGAEALGASLPGGDWSLVKLTPAHLDLLGARMRDGAAGDGAGAGGAAPGRIGALVVGGEALRGESLAPWVEAFAGTRPINEYGPTETVVGCCVYEVPPEAVAAGAVPIGRPIANTRLYVLDRHLRPVPAGVPGELWVGGAGVARGYLKRPARTAERFRPDAFGADPGDRMYGTGDLVRYLPDGNLEFLGRFDHQVKIRGFRIELGEIEAVLGAHPEVREVAVVARERDGDRFLAAYVVAEPDHAPAETELRDWLRQRLPDYMVPAAWTRLAALPLTAHGKVDRRALPEPRTAAEAETAAPSTPVAEILANLWAEALHRDRIAGGDSFFDLGGHSLLATQVITRIREVLGVEMPLRSLFDHPTLDAFSAQVEAALRRGHGLEMPPIEPVPRDDGRMVASFAQQRLYFLETLMPGTTLYHIPIAVRVEGPLDFAALERGFAELVRRHESLRTVFAAERDGVVQVIRPAAPAGLPRVDLTALSEAARERESLALAGREARRLFDLEHGPLLRTTVLRLAEREHVLLVNMHHIVSDGWSVGVLVRELSALFEAFSRRRPAALPALPVQYADYAHWQRRWLRGETLETQLAYWKTQLGDAEPLDLPTDRPRSKVRNWRGAEVPVFLRSALADGLEMLSRGRRATLFMTLLAAFDLLLHRYAGRRSVVVGTPIANRTAGETEGLIGFFVNTLAMAVELGDDPTFGELLARVREASLGAYAHQDLPFEMLVEELEPERDLSRTPLFEVMFALQNAPAEAIDLAEQRISLLPAGPGSAKFDWTLSLEPTPAGLVGSLQYASALFDATTIRRVLGHFEVLLEGLLADPDRRLSELPILTRAERLQAIEHAGTAAVRPAGAQTLDRLFADAAARFPDAVAAVCGDERWSYRALDRRADRLARLLRRHGVGPEVRVALCAERSFPMLLGLLGTIKAGGAYVPLDPAYPQTRLDYLLRDSGASVLLVEPHLLAHLPPYDGVVVTLGGHAEPAAGDEESAGPVASGTAAGSAAYVIYTSGSTGDPKGVVVTHGNVARLFAATRRWFEFGPADTWTLFHSYAFDFSVWEIWGALLHGGRLAIVPHLVSRSPEAFRALLADERVTVLNQTPSAFAQLRRVDQDKPARGLALRLVVFGGEALDLQALEPWFLRHGDRTPRLVNMYGITETTVHVTYRPIALADLQRTAASVIGEPIPDLRLRILDRKLQPVPFGVAGEICVGGAGLARGYLDRPALTAERFCPDPWSDAVAAPGARLYRSGDLGRRLPDGDVEYLGRIDHQVKIRGFRIELGEIEAALRAAPAVAETVVTAREDAAGDVRLVAYVVARGGRSPAADELQTFLRARLPEHAVPASFVALDRLPLTEHGKLDFRALPAPDSARPELRSEYEPPQTAHEKILARVWAETLGLERVGIRDNFFALGGDSIRSIQILTRAREAGLELSLQQLFQHPTIAELLAAMERDGAVSATEIRTRPFDLVAEADRERLPPDVEDAYPLTKLQAGMLYHMDLMPDSPVYHNVDSFLLQVPFDLEKLQASVDQAVARHPTLRTSFHLGSYSEPLQLVHAEARLEITVEDLRGLTPEDQERAVDAYIDGQRLNHFDFTRAPQLRMHVQRRSEEAFQFTLTENHAILDGWSLHSTLLEIFDHYRVRLRGETPAVEPPPALPFREFVAMELEALRSEPARAYWDRHLDGFSALELPRWSPSTPASTAGPRIVSRETPVPFEVADALRRLAAQTAVPIKTVLLAAHLKALSVLSGSLDVITGMVTHGRPEEAGGEETRGLFLNTLPVRLRLAAGTWVDLVRAVFADEQEQMRYRRYPLSELQKKFGDRPLFETAFNFTHFHVVEGILQSGDVQVLGFKKSEETSMTLVAGFHVNPLTHHIGLELAFDATQIPEAQARVFASHYLRLLDAMAADPFAAHHDAVALTPAQRHQVLAEWNDTVTGYDREATLHRLFETAAARRPDAVAVVAENGCLTYGELNRRANRLAHRLIAAGVAAGDLVALYLERRQEMPIALLGVLKAGGAYVPLSNDWPAARSEWILSTLGVRHLVTDRHRLDEARALRESSASLDHLLIADAGTEDPRTDANPDAAAGAHHLAYIIFTSGSTGHPKGVAVRHRPVINLIEWIERSFGVGPADRVLFTTSLSFDLSVYDVFGLLAAGGSIRVASSGELAEPERLVRVLRDGAITFWDSAPAALQRLVPLFSTVPDLDASALRLVFLSGDWIPLPLPDLVRESFPRARVVSLGGATEATVWSNFHPVERVEPEWISIPYGRPIANARYHVLDAWLSPCPLGTPGDLYIGGECLSSGYAAAPRITAERYLPDPWGERPGGRLYATGDRARYWPDGNLEFLGRLDHQVKIRGFRIELGEIEATLLQHPAVRDAVVLAREDVPGEKRLVAYWVARATPAPEAADLRDHLLQSLPEYMVPPIFVPLPALPLTPNGKVDRGALPMPEIDRLRSRPFVAPRTALERTLAEIWRDVLGLDQVGIHDDFFEAGGHSLLAIQLVTKIREELSADLPLRILFDRSTVADLAVAVAGARTVASARPATLPTVTPAPDALTRPFPLTDLQQAYWLGQRAEFDLGNVSAHIYQEFELPALDVARLERAWRRMIERHPMLRAEVLPDGRQRILERTPPYRIPVLDLSGLDADRAEAAAMALGRHMAEDGPSTDRWPLFDFRLSRLDRTRYRAHLSASLLLCDAVSFYVLTEELIRYYADPDAALPPLELSFRDYVLALGAFEGSETFERSRAYWLDRLPELPSAPALPVVTSPGQAHEVRFDRHGWELDADDWSRAKARAAQAGLTPTALILAAYAQVLAAFSRSPRFTVNILFFNRLPVHPQVNDVIGNFSSTILLEIDGSAEESFELRAKRIQQRLWQDMEHSVFSGVRVLRELNRMHGVGSNPVMPVVFTSDINLIPEEAGAAEAEEETAGQGPVFRWGALQTPQVWLDHQISEREGRLTLNWDVLRDLFPPGLVEEMFAAYRDLVSRLADDELWRSSTPLRPSAALQALVARYNATETPVPDGLLHDGFERQARRRPDEPAVITPERTLTYGELYRRSVRVGRRLRALGARPDTLVAVVMDKSWEQVVAVLGILHAGAAYLPIDPEVPGERLRYLLDNGGVELALVRRRHRDALEWPSTVRPLTVDDEDVAAAGDEPLEPVQRPTDLAYVIFTSGSTGRPKGVSIEHAGALNTVVDVNRRFDVGPGDRVLALSALNFDLSVYDVFGLLAAGGAIVMPDEESLREPSRWLELMVEHRVTLWNSVPALMEMLVDHLAESGRSMPGALRLAMLSGDWIPVTLPGRIRALSDRVETISLGGATEASIWSILYPIDEVPPEWTSIPYGRPMDNQRFYVLDETLEPRPVWVPGELYIGGVGVARGYWRDEARTAASFVEHPRTGERLYRTGDFGRWLPDRQIEFLGREDLQVKVQGYRIELGEIEAALLDHPGVRIGAVAALGELRGSKRLVAFFVPAADGSVTVDALRGFLAERLPQYMIPAAFVELEALPLTANGKVDRRALAEAADADAGPQAGRIAPRDEVELKLVEIWEALLDTRPIGVCDSFFDLGGHSLLAVRLMSRIRAELGTELPISTLFEAPTIEHLAPLLRRGRARPERSIVVKIQPRGERRPFFCAHPVGGSVLGYRELAGLLDAEQPFYGLQTPAGPRPPDLEGYAARYVEALREVQPEGPYLLGGWSMGGVLAFEMAQQLHGRGEEVELVAMIDSSMPERAPREVDDATLTSWFARDLGGLAGAELAIAPGELRELDPEARLARLLERARAAHVLPPDLSVDGLRDHLSTFLDNYRALLGYVPRRYPGELVLFAARDEPGAAAAAEAWSRLAAKGAEIHALPGDHYTIMRPPRLATLGGLLDARIAAATRKRARVYS